MAEEAQRKKQSIVFLPCHRSHVDYVSLQLICYRLGLALPTVVAGDNLNIPVLGAFLQSAGKSVCLLMINTKSDNEQALCGYEEVLEMIYFTLHLCNRTLTPYSNEVIISNVSSKAADLEQGNYYPPNSVS